MANIKQKNTKKVQPKAKKTTKLPAKLVKYLENAGVDHNILEHRTVYTAIDAANTLKKKMEEIAKTLYIKADKDYYVVILPADHNLDFEKLSACMQKAGIKANTIKIPGEKIIETVFKAKAEALTAFGNLHKMGVVVEKKLEKAGKTVFSAGSLNHSVEMAAKDFINLEKAIVGSFGVKKKIKKIKVTAPKAAKKNPQAVKKEKKKK